MELFEFASAGEISMESSGGLFDYFESLIALTTPEFDLAKGGVWWFVEGNGNLPRMDGLPILFWCNKENECSLRCKP